MARSFLTAVNLNKNELQNAAVQNLGTAPSAPVTGQIYYDSTANILYWWNGSQWIAAQGAAGAIPAATVTTQAVGDAPVVGASTNYAREDHKHGREAFGVVSAQTGFGSSSFNGSAVTLSRSDHMHGTPTHDVAAHAAIPISGLAPATGPINMGGFVIGNVGTPVAPTDAANKGYVDNAIAGLSWKQPVSAATTANITLSGLQTIDGLGGVVGYRILVKNQTLMDQNGIYVMASGAWTRTTDADTGTELLGAAVFVSEGTTQGDTSWVCTTNGPITVGASSLVFVQFAGGGAYLPLTGGTLTGPLTITGTGTRLSIPSGAASLGAITLNNYLDANSVNLHGSGANLTVGGSLSSVDFSGVATQVVLPSITPTAANHATTKAYVDGLTTGGVRKYTQAIGDGTSTSYVVTHSITTGQVIVQVYRVLAPSDLIDCDVEKTNSTSVTVRFATAPTSNQYNVVVMG